MKDISEKGLKSGIENAIPTKIVLDMKAMVTGIGRKATDEELTYYLSKGSDIELIGLKEAFAKYQSDSPNH